MEKSVFSMTNDLYEVPSVDDSSYSQTRKTPPTRDTNDSPSSAQRGFLVTPIASDGGSSDTGEEAYSYEDEVYDDHSDNSNKVSNVNGFQSTPSSSFHSLYKQPAKPTPKNYTGREPLNLEIKPEDVKQVKEALSEGLSSVASMFTTLADEVETAITTELQSEDEEEYVAAISQQQPAWEQDDEELERSMIRSSYYDDESPLNESIMTPKHHYKLPAKKKSINSVGMILEDVVSPVVPTTKKKKKKKKRESRVAVIDMPSPVKPKTKTVVNPKPKEVQTKSEPVEPLKKKEPEYYKAPLPQRQQHQQRQQQARERPVEKKKNNELLLHPVHLKTDDQLLVEQRERCARCSNKLERSFWGNKWKYCEYANALYCPECMPGDTWWLPRQLIHHLDTERYDVSRHAFSFLQSVYSEPRILLAQVRPQIFQQSLAFGQVRRLRYALSLLNPVVSDCKKCHPVLHKFRSRWYMFEDHAPLNLTDDAQVESDIGHVSADNGKQYYSLRDIIDIIDSDLALQLQTLVDQLTAHILGGKCQTCARKGATCGAAHKCKGKNREKNLLYAFDFERVSRCMRCDTLYHTQCLPATSTSMEDGCMKCTIVKVHTVEKVQARLQREQELERLRKVEHKRREEALSELSKRPRQENDEEEGADANAFAVPEEPEPVNQSTSAHPSTLIVNEKPSNVFNDILDDLLND